MSDNETVILRDAIEDAQAETGLIAHGIGKSYKKRQVVKNVSLQVQRGEAVGLLGPNGAGKTTSFYMIVGLVQPIRGRSRSTVPISPSCRCIAGRVWASGISLRKPVFFAD